jgi:hypothetical protein
VETIKTPGLLQPLSIPSQRWEEVSMNFITGLPKFEGKSVDPGGYWWPPTYSTWTPTIASFSFSVSAQFTIFSSFSGPELPEPF